MGLEKPLVMCEKCVTQNINESCKGIFSYQGFYTIVKVPDNMQCTKCGNNLTETKLTVEEFKVLSTVSKNISFILAMIKLKETDIIEYESRMSQFRSQVQQQKVAEKAVEEKSKPKLTCPKCGSSEVTEGTRGFTLTTGFLGSGNFRYVCKRCGNKWKPGSMLEILQRANNNHWDD